MEWYFEQTRSIKKTSRGSTVWCQRSRQYKIFYERPSGQRAYSAHGARRSALFSQKCSFRNYSGFKLSEIIQNRRALHKTLFSATRKFFGSNNSKNAQISEKYSESVEVQIRKLADLQFLLQQYQKAAENYASAKREMSNEQNWVEATSGESYISVEKKFRSFQLLKWRQFQSSCQTSIAILFQNKSLHMQLIPI